MPSHATSALDVDLPTVRALEERAFNAWPARQTVFHQGWVFRLSGGFTKRANSINALEPGMPFDGVREATQAIYASQGLRPVFRISPLVSASAEQSLQDAGYALFEPTWVMQAPLLEGAPPQPSVEIAQAPTAEWLDGFAAANGVAAAHHATHHAMVQSIALPCAFATVRQHGHAVGFGVGVRERGAVGLFDIVVAPGHRGQGHGRALVQALMQWGQAGGAGSAYLQVRGENATARRLYATLEFTDTYRYHYRVPAHPGSPP
ncbi:GNAT family N-acetyltransferase [Acidovorax sp. SUPP2522]|uniref:GNAT family N-acetyltransferase n=1 Tax=unclassified Acidovorax TaxID=2684926 RepID=UPI00234A6281|nr:MULTISPECIES: GNAT family N-acetyltransferase [unclassified Acidovorax]WCM99831.1 GNAT family N-acetyltransferase [Acidovorax sp. GBBC 1281]GKT14783.1 GNAT family N-acetyltransferase [Acidovorax sp. SUPP2522]